MKSQNEKTTIPRRRPNKALAIYVASITFVMVTYSLVTAVQYL